MNYATQNCFRTVRGTLVSGAILGFILVLVYSFVFTVYATIRSSLQIVMILSLVEGLIGTLVANTFALFMPALFMALIFGLGAALLQSVTLLLVHGAAAMINPHHWPALTAWIGLVIASLLAGLIHFVVQRSLGLYFIALWPTGYFFWLGLPSLLFIGMTTWISWRVAGHRVGGQVHFMGAAALVC